MIKLHDIDHVLMGVEDLDESTHQWQDEFGLTVVGREPGESFLACNYEDPALILRSAPAAGIIHTAYQLAPDVTLADAEKHLSDAGVEFTRSELGVTFADLEGNGIQFVEYKPVTDQDRYPREWRSTTRNHRIGAPRKLGHVNYLTANFDKQLDFYLNVVGMKLADKLGADAGAFLHLGADHHVMAFVNTGQAHFHHIAFDMQDWGQIRQSFDHLAQYGRVMPWGPVRHGIGGNLAGYVRLPEADCFIELYCDIEQLAETHTPREYPDDRHSSNVWGMLPPRSYFRFDKESIEAERESLQAIWEKQPELLGS
ncbi:VOC family protein [Rhodococcus sp. NPDC057529]|uniref:VOC family protein n=1 Tax=Rhodococcus sp. NPDC057529 TaxID=3346158 RepID=UPI00366B7D30